MTLLAAYDQACKALADVTSVKEALGIAAELEHVKLYARRVGDKELLERAIQRQLDAERRLGELIVEGQRAGLIAAPGRRPKPKDDQPPPARLEEIGLTPKMSAKAQKAAALSPDEFKQLRDAVGERVRSGRAILIDPIEDGAINGARAIMSSRVEPDDSLDYFPTPPWATRALIERAFSQLKLTPGFSAWEPACGEGHIAEVLKEYFSDVYASDIHSYGYGGKLDFLDSASTDRFIAATAGVDWIITNPPFDEKAEQFLFRALELANVGVALFVRLQWLEGEGRYARIYSQIPPTLIAFFSERVNLCKGRWDPDGSTATAYVWLIWKHNARPQAPYWFAPDCRDTLTRADDAARFTTHPVTKRILEAA